MKFHHVSFQREMTFTHRVLGTILSIGEFYVETSDKVWKALVKKIFFIES